MLNIKKLDFGKLGAKALGLGGGAVGARFLHKQLPAGWNPQLKNFGVLAAGVLVSSIDGKPDSMTTHLGNGMIATAASEFIKQAFPDAIKGIGEGGEEEETVTYLNGVGNPNAYMVEEETDYRLVNGPANEFTTVNGVGAPIQTVSGIGFTD